MRLGGVRDDAIRRIAALAAVSIAAAGAVAVGIARAAPANDSFAAAVVLDFASGSVTGSNVGATREPSEPVVDEGAFGYTVWYRWTAATSGPATIDTYGSTFQTSLGVFTGSRVDALTLVGSSIYADGTTRTRWSSVTFQATAGTTYHVQVDVWRTSPGTFTLRVNPPPPPNDDFADARVLAGESGTASGSTVRATAEPGEPSHWNAPLESIWFRWTPQAGGRVTFTPSGSDGRVVMAIYTGSALTSLTPVRKAVSDPVSFTASPGTTYHVALDTQITTPGDVSVTWTRPGPVNDAFAAATSIAGSAGTVTGENWFGTKEAGELDHAGRPGGASVWWRWTAPADGTMEFRTAGTAFDTVLAAYTGSSLGALTPVAQNDDDGTARTSHISFAVTQGAVYSIVADGGAGEQGDITLAWGTTAPANDDFADAILLSGTSGRVTGSNAGGTVERGEPGLDAYTRPNHTVWYRWAPATSGIVVFDTVGSSFSPTLAIWTGTSLDELVSVGRGRFVFRAGTTYSIQLGTWYGGGGPGMFVLNWRLESSVAPAPPPNDAFASGEQIDGDVGRIVGSTLGASKEVGEPDRQRGGASVWYRWTAPFHGTVTFSILEADFDGEVDVFEGTTLAGLIPVAEYQPRTVLSFDVRFGTTYSIRVDGYGGQSGTFALDWARWAPPPANDAFPAAELIAGERGAVAATNLGATAEPGEPSHLWSQPLRSIWFRWTPPATATYTFSLDQTLLEDGYVRGVVAVYTGPTLRELRRIAAGVDSVSFVGLAGTEYRIAVDYGSVWGIAWQPTGPPNDRFDSPTTIAGERGSVSGSTEGASREPGEPASTGNRSVWFAWTAPASGSVTFDTSASEFDTKLAVFTGTAVDDLVRIAANDDAGGFKTSAVTLGATAGMTYRIAVGGVSAFGAYRLNWKMAPTGPPNDLFASATTLSGTAGTVTVSNAGAGKEPGEPIHGGKPGGASIWFRWTAPASGPLSFDTLQTRWLDTQVAVYTGASVDALTLVAENDFYAPYYAGAAIARFDAVAGQTYAIAVDGWTDGDPYTERGVVTGQFQLQWAARPANDDFGRAQTVSGASGSVTGSTLNGTFERGEPWHNGRTGGTGGTSVWYTWTAPSGGTATFTLASAFSDVLAVYTGDRPDALQLVARGDYWSGDRATFAVRPGTVYRLAVDGDYVGQSGSFTLSWSLAGPANDAFERPRSISFYYAFSAGSLTQSTVGATKQTGEPSHAGDAGGASVWFAFTAPAYERVRFETTGSEFDTVLAVYEGSTLSTLTPVAADDDSAGAGASAVEFQTFTGRAYRIAVDGKAAASGMLSLAWRPVPPGPPSNDSFATPMAIVGGFASTTLAGATREPGEPSHGDYEDQGTVWFTWTPPSTGAFAIRTEPVYGAGIAVYVGDRLDALDRVDRDEGRRFWATAGTTYRIAAFGEPTFLNVYVEPSASPPNDAFANAQPIGEWSGEVRGSTRDATLEAHEPDSHWGPSIWYRWTAPAAGVVIFRTEQATAYRTPDILHVYAGPDLPGLRFLGAGTEVPVSVVTGEVVYMVLDHHPQGVEPDELLSWRSGPAGPPNDRFENAVLLGPYGSVDGRTYRATAQPGEPRESSNSIWYRWTAPASGRATFSVLASETAAGVAVYEGGSIWTLRLVDDGVRSAYYGWRDPEVHLDAVAGTTYHVAVSTPGGPRPPNAIVWLQWGLRPANDDFAAAETISGADGRVDGRNLGATKEVGEPPHSGDPGGASVWYRWTAPASGSVIVDTVGSDFDTLLGVYTGSDLATLSRVDGDDEAGGDHRSRVVFDAVAGTTYRIAVDGYRGALGLVVLNWRYGPRNDAFGAAERIWDRYGRIAGSNVGATAETGEPVHAGASGGASVWYTWVPGVAGDVVIDTAGSSFDTLLAVYVGDAVGSLRAVASSDDADGLTTGRVEFVAEAGVPYRIAVDGKGGATGRLFLNWSQLDAPPHDLFADATPLIGAAGELYDSNFWATKEVGEPDHAGDPGGASVWYRWTAPFDTPVSFETVDPYFDSVMAVYTGLTVSSLTLVAANDDKGGYDEYWVHASRVQFRATAGTTYFIAVDGKAGEVSDFELWWNPPPPRDSFDSWPYGDGPKSGWIEGTNAWATKQLGEPSHAGDAGGASIWFNWTAPEDGAVTFDTAGSDFDTLLAVYTGEYVGKLAPIAANDDDGTAPTSRVTFSVLRNVVYRIAVDGRGGAVGFYRLNWLMSGQSPPANDHFAAATPLTMTVANYDYVRALGNTVLATSEPGEPDHGGAGHSIWFRWTAPSKGNLRIERGDQTRAAVYRGSSLATLERVDSMPDPWTTFSDRVTLAPVSAGTTYYIAFDQPGSASATVGAWLTFHHETPANDDLAAAQPLPGDEGQVTGRSDHSGPEPGERFGNGRSVWYSWTPSVGGRATLDVRASFTSAQLAVFTGSSVATLERVPAEELSWRQIVRFEARPGITYKIAVFGGRADWGSDSGYVSLTRTLVKGDYFSGPRPLTGSTGRVTAATALATREPGEPAHAGNPGGHSLWFKWTAAYAGPTTFDTAGSSFDTLLAVYTGATLGALAPVAANDDGVSGAATSVVTFDAVAGRTYLIAVDGYSGVSGDLVLNWAGVGPPDTTPPTVALTAPAEGASVGNTATLAASATDDVGVADVEFFVRGVSVGVDGDAPYTIQWQSWTMADGPATVEARARDSAGNVAAATRSVTLDNTDPTVTITSYAPSPNESPYSTFAFTSNEPGTFECRLDGVAWEPCTSPKTYTGLATGSHWFHVRAIDRAGNVSSEAYANWYVIGPPDNDAFAGATTLAAASGSVTGSTVNATKEAGEPNHAGNAGGHSVWYRWTAPAGGTATFTTTGSTFDTLLAVYTGSSVSALSLVASNNDERKRVTTSRVSFTAVAGRTYSIAVDGYRGATGSVALGWTGPADTTAPDTSVTAGPSGTVASTSASFSFTATETGSTFQCRVDAAAFAACTSPKSYAGLSEGQHTFEVRAVDAAGNVDATPATRTWTIDTVAPDTTITAGPAAASTSTSASFEFAATEVGATFQCSLDDAAFAACTSPKSFSGLASGSHIFRVRAADGAGNVDATPAERTWTISATAPPPDTAAPETTVDSGPPAETAETSATLTFSASETGSTFECSLDGAAFTACTSPAGYSGLATGAHAFRVRATDAAGNVDATPAERSWTIVAATPPPPSSSAYAAAVLADGPLAYWRLGETSGAGAADASGNARAGSYEAGVALGAVGALTGDADTAAGFDGVDDRVSVPHDAALQLNGAFTIEFWARTTSFANSFPGLLVKGTSWNANGYLVWYWSDGALYFKRNGIQFPTSAGMLTSSFRHFAVTYDGQTLRWYVDGVLDTTSAQSYPANAGTDPLHLGRGDEFGAHVLDEVAIYATALTAERILAHVQAGRS